MTEAAPGARKGFKENTVMKERPGRGREVSLAMTNNKCSQNWTQNQLKTEEHLRMGAAPEPFNQDKFAGGDKPWAYFSEKKS